MSVLIKLTYLEPSWTLSDHTKTKSETNTKKDNEKTKTDRKKEWYTDECKDNDKNHTRSNSMTSKEHLHT